jgi:putative 4-mercaptohistidine N1-methyltranferase
MANFYETERALSEYILFHYGKAEEILTYGGPAEALFYPVRCISECLDVGQLPVRARALDLGCAVGRSTFELARHCVEVIGIDYSHRFIETASLIGKQGEIPYSYVVEGELTRETVAAVPPELDRTRVSFEQGDAQQLRPDLGQFDAVLMANLIDRLPRPGAFLEQTHELLRSGGQLIITSPYTWLTDYTPSVNWLGGLERNGKIIHTFDTLQAILGPNFALKQRKNLPFLIREHARKYQWSVAEATVWVRK